KPPSPRTWSGTRIIRTRLVITRPRHFGWRRRAVLSRAATAKRVAATVTGGSPGSRARNPAVVCRPGRSARDGSRQAIDSDGGGGVLVAGLPRQDGARCRHAAGQGGEQRRRSQDRKSTRLNSSHVKISYAVFCLK